MQEFLLIYYKNRKKKDELGEVFNYDLFGKRDLNMIFKEKFKKLIQSKL
jgi:hypothetical protein